MNNLTTNLVYLMILGVIVAGVGVNIIAATTVNADVYENDGADWIRYDYTDGAEDYSITATVSGSTVTVGDQSGEMGDMIIYADDTSAIVTTGGKLVYLYRVVFDGEFIGRSNDLGDSASVTITDNTVTIQGVGFGADHNIAWAYVPDSSGAYGCFDSGDLTVKPGDGVAAMGYFAGVNTYNRIVTPDYGLIEDADVTEGQINSVNWVKDD